MADDTAATRGAGAAGGAATGMLAERQTGAGEGTAVGGIGVGVAGTGGAAEGATTGMLAERRVGV